LLVLTARGRVEANHGTAIELIFGLDDRKLAGIHRVAQDFAVGEHVFRALVHILFYCGFEQIIRLGVGLGLNDGGVDLVHDLRLGILSPEQAAATAPHF
jgi:hypothetical protein